MWPFDKENKAHLKKLESQISEASQKYKRVFGGEDGIWVLQDLAKRGFDRITIYDPDDFKRGMNEGRRSLFNYIRTMVEKDLTQILEDLTKE
ncbi:MAG: hypothetical protein WC312_03870 [Candidatus Omnitrophota bacterium]|jgi:tRNA A37 threonylcarbamoyladenosine dehydratase